MNKQFSIIQSLCRAIISGDKELISHQLERLADDYSKSGQDKEARSIRSYIGRLNSTENIGTVNLSTSSFVRGEELTKQVVIPSDKETAMPLLEVLPVNELPANGPLFNDNVMEAVDSLVLEWTNYEKLLKAGATPSRSCLIYGKPGTGKTFLAKRIGKLMGLPVVLARLDGIVSSFLGTSSRNIRTLFEFANRYKCILLLDEFDAIAKLRDDPQEIGEVKRVVNTLLQNLDERENIGFTIGITNNEVILDPAVWRRFDAQIDIPDPDEHVIEQLLRLYIKPVQLSEGEFKFLSWCMQGSTGADIQKLTDWIKRMKLLDKYKDDSAISLMRRYALLNTGRLSDKVKNLLQKDNKDVATYILDTDKDIKKKDVAEIFSISPSSLSKQISKVKV